jgi:hypothetical protein
MTSCLRAFALFITVSVLLVSPTAFAQDDISLDDIELEPIVPVENEAVDVSKEAVSQDSLEETVSLDFGLKLRQRSFNVDSAAANLDLSSALYPTIYLGGELYPFGDMGWLADFGFSGSFSYGVDTTVIDEAGVVRKVPTRHLELEVLLNYRNRINDLFLVEANTGVMVLDFVLSFNQLYSSSTYRAWQLRVNGVYSLLSWLDVEGGIKFFPIVGLGVSESEFGTDSSTFGAAFQVAAEAEIVDGLYVHGGYDLLAFSSDFTGRGARGLESPVTTDVFHSMAVWAGYRF